MKKCITCNVTKEATKEFFYGDRTTKDLLCKRCKVCDNIRTDTRKLRRTAKIKDAPCTDCGRQYQPWQMGFDHRQGEVKTAEIWQLRSRSVEELRKELRKCDLLCLNCHANRTYMRSKGLLHNETKDSMKNKITGYEE